MSFRETIRDNAVHALINANTRAGQNVFTPRTWPGWSAQYPMLVVRTPRVRRTGTGPHGPPSFRSLVDLTVHARLGHASEAEADELARELATQVEDAILRNGWFIHHSCIEEFASVDIAYEVTSQSREFIAEMRALFSCQVLEVFEPTIDADGDCFPPRHEVVGVNLRADLAGGMVDPTGDYPAPTNPAYTPTPAPRTEGPDGRIEGGADIDLNPAEE